MRRSFLLVPLLVVTAVPGPASARGCADADLVPSSGNLSSIRTSTLCLMNAERRKHGRKALRSQATLRRAADRYARDMVRRNFFDHVTPGGMDLVARIRRTPYLDGVSGWSLGENLAWGSGELGTPRETVRAWMKSQGHRANLLRKAFTEVGVGVAFGAPVDAHAAGFPAATYATEFGRRS